ncbi:MAG: outer membrane protein transport protein [Myxococcales bacterium]|nr:outer membrane protein transport protein [Myxococcales bacterium]
MRLLAGLFVSLAPLVAVAQPLELYGFNPRAVGMGGVQAGADESFTAVHYNPALLGKGTVGFGFNWSKPSMRVEVLEGEGQPTILMPTDYASYTVGGSVPLAGLLADRAAVGFGVLAPARIIFRSRMIDEGDAYFYRFDNMPSRLQVLVGASGRPLEWLRLGAGAELASNYGGAARFSATLGTTEPGRILRRNVESELIGIVSPRAGLAVGPFRSVRAFAAWRGEVKAVYSLPIQVDLGELGSLDVMVNGVSHYAPNVYAAGLSWEPMPGLTVAADLSFEQWSRSPPPVADISIALPSLLVVLGYNGQIVSREVSVSFADAWVPRVGAEWVLQERIRLRAGYFYRPSPVPADQGRRTSYLDSTAHVASLGAGYAFDDPLRMASRLTVDAAAQVAFLEPREGRRSALRYRFGGSTVDVAVAVGYEF